LRRIVLTCRAEAEFAKQNAFGAAGEDVTLTECNTA